MDIFYVPEQEGAHGEQIPLSKALEILRSSREDTIPADDDSLPLLEDDRDQR